MSIHPNTKEAYKLLHDGVLAFAKAEQQGFRIDLEYCEQKTNELTDRIVTIEEDLRASRFYRDWQRACKGAVNFNSGDQLGKFLYGTMKLPPPKTTTSGKGSTDEDALKALNIPELNQILQMRKLKKLRDTYLGGFIKEEVGGVVHPFFNLHKVVTYRSSSDSPNFQNIPKRDEESMEICRRALFPRRGNQLAELDFKGIEVAIAACYHKDPTMLTYLKDKSKDMHGDMAEQLYLIKKLDKSLSEHKTLRSATKNSFVFPQFYGDYYKNCAVNLAHTWGGLSSGKWKPGQGIQVGGEVHLSDHFISHGIKSMNAYTEHVRDIENDFWGKRFPVYAKWKERHWSKYIKTGYVDLLTGFRCSALMSKNDAINYPVQGAAFHCLLWCFIELDKQMQYLKMESRLLGQIHDAIIIDIYPPELEQVSALAKKVMTVELNKVWKWIMVPLEVEMELGPIDGSWADLKNYKF